MSINFSEDITGVASRELVNLISPGSFLHENVIIPEKNRFEHSLRFLESNLRIKSLHFNEQKNLRDSIVDRMQTDPSRNNLEELTSLEIGNTINSGGIKCARRLAEKFGSEYFTVLHDYKDGEGDNLESPGVICTKTGPPGILIFPGDKNQIIIIDKNPASNESDTSNDFDWIKFAQESSWLTGDNLKVKHPSWKRENFTARALHVDKNGEVKDDQNEMTLTLIMGKVQIMTVRNWKKKYLL